MNPAILSPASRFAVLERRTGRRSPSISPDRWRSSANSGLDPLLFNLSPTSTLQALEALDAPLSGHDILQDSLAAASASDRVFGIRAALAGKKLKEWHREISAWPWLDPSFSNGFRPLAITQQGKERLSLDREGYSNGLAPAASAQELGGLDEEEEYCGSMPKKLVQEYEDRIENIQQEMDELEFEDLKAYVRNAHMNPHSRPEGRRLSGLGVVASDYNHLDEFTAVITATIMHALPTIFHLSSLLSVWSTRLAVLRNVPGFLELLKDSQINMETEAKMYQNMEFGGDGKELEHMKTTFASRRDVLEAKIFELGRRLDTMLDLLEGKEDTVPEEWIDEMEALESDFSGWVVETERRFMEQFLKIHQRDGGIQPPSADEENVRTEPPAPAPSNNQGLLQNNRIAQDGGSSIPDYFDGVVPLSLAHEDPHESDRLVDHSQYDRSEIIISRQESSLSGAECLPSNTISKNDIERSSTPTYVNTPTSNLQLNSPTENITREQVPEPREDLRLANDETDDSAFEKIALSDDSIADQSSKEFPREGKAFTPPLHDAREDQTIETGSNVSVESKREIGSLEPWNENSIDEAMPSSSENSTRIGSSVPSRANSLSSPVCSMTLHDLEAQLPESIMNQKIVTTPRPSPLVIRSANTNYDGNASSEMSSDASLPGSGTSEYFSNMSSPEIQHAKVAEYFENPVEVTTSLKSPSTPMLPLSRQSSQRTERGEGLTYDNDIALPSPRPINHTRRASSFAPESTIYESTRPGDEKRVRPNYLNSHSRVRSASLRSFEIIPRTEVRNIIISRKRDSALDLEPRHYKSETSLPSPQLFTELAIPKAPAYGDWTAPTEPAMPKAPAYGDWTAPTEPAMPKAPAYGDWPAQPKENKNLREAISSSSTPPEALIEEALPTQRPQEDSSRSQHRFENYSDLRPGSTPAKVRQRKPAGRLGFFSNKGNATNNNPSLPSQNSEDKLEARISSILTEIPGRIRLKSGPEDDAREILPSSNSSGRKRPFLRSLATKSMRTSPGLSSPALTLTPAHPKHSTSRGQDGDPEIKLYHLHQPGKDVPIKLFVRLVGEGGERVMVRIGGGWADLAEYLKEYAIHHGRRSTSNGQFEIQGMPQSPSATSSSGAAGLPSSPTSPSRPNSSSGRPNQTSHPPSRPKRHSFGSAPAEPNDRPVTPSNPSRVFRSFEPVTPGSVESNASSYPLRPSSRLSSNTDDDSPSIGLGLAGPRSRRTVVSPTKQAWVDGMVDQARKVSGEKRKPSLKGGKAEVVGDFGDLGRVGSTKRVFMKMRKDGVRGGAGAGAGAGVSPGSGSASASASGSGAGTGTASGTGPEAQV